MSYQDVAEAIRAKFKTDVATPNSLVVVNDNQSPQNMAQSWYRLSVLFDGQRQVHSGTATTIRWRITGRAVLNLFAPAAKGEGTLMEIVDATNAAFRGDSVASPIVEFRPAPALQGVAERDDAWWRRTMTIYFEADVFG